MSGMRNHISGHCWHDSLCFTVEMSSTDWPQWFGHGKRLAQISYSGLDMGNVERGLATVA